MAVVFDLQQYKAQLGGRRAKRNGDEHEMLVDAALNRLADAGLLAWHATGPKVKYIPRRSTRRGQMVTTAEPKVIGEGPADRLVAYDNSAIWLEVKGWANKNTCTYRESLHQFEVMAAFAKFGFMGAYLVRWNFSSDHSTDPEWRLHPLSTLSKIVDGTGEKGYGLLFNRETGIYVPETWEGVPHLHQPLEAMICSA